MFNIAKNVKDESENKLTTSKLIAYNSEMPTTNNKEIRRQTTHSPHSDGKISKKRKKKLLLCKNHLFILK
jgi:hypothetical protein